MPRGGRTFTYYDAEGEAYPFFAKDRQESTARHKALLWARKHGIRLFRVKHGTSPTRRKS